MKNIFPREVFPAAERPTDEQVLPLLARAFQFLLWVAAPAISITFYFQESPAGWSWVAIPEVIVIGAVGWICLRRGQVTWAIHVFLWGLLALVSMQCVLVNGIRTPAVMAYPVLLMMSGWLLGRRAAFAMMTITLLWLTGISVFSEFVWEALLIRDTATYWVTATLASGLSAILAQHVAETNRRRRHEDLDRAAELARRLGELQAARDELATLFHLNPMPVSITRIEDGTYCDANPAWLRVSGWSRSEMIGKTSTELGIWLTPEDRQHFVDVVKRDGHTFNYLASFRMRDGEIRHFLLNAEATEFDGVPCIFSAFVDITERRIAETSLERLNSDLEQRVTERTESLSETLSTLRRAQDELVQSDKLASLGALVAGVAHELNTPIGNAVLIASTLGQDMRELERSYLGGELRKSSLDLYLTEAKGAVGLLEKSLEQARDLLSSFKQVAVDQSSERRRSFSLSSLVHDVCETVRAGLRQERWQLETDFALDLHLDSYPGPLGQVITNLVQNALFHGLQENVPGIVRIETRALDEGYVQISVSDNGRGIPAENLGRIFDPFFTTRLGQGGSGLGLSIVYRLVTTLLGGRICVDSTWGAGARFTVVLPLQAPLSAA